MLQRTMVFFVGFFLHAIEKKFAKFDDEGEIGGNGRD
jgi:hypothetical protein